MSIKSKYRLVFCLFAVLSVSACEKFHLDMLKVSNHDLFTTHAGEAQYQAEHEAMNKTGQSSRGDVTPLPVQNPSRQSAMPAAVGSIETNSVEIFDMEPIAGYTRGGSPQQQQAPAYNTQPPMAAQSSVQVNPIMGGNGQGQFAADKSVMIYGLDGQEVQSGFDFSGSMARTPVGQSYSDNSFSSRGSRASFSTASAGNQILFKHGSSRLGRGDIRKISGMAEEAKFAPVDYISVEGYASRPTQYGRNTTQAHIINLRQSMKRSEKVSKALIAKGVPGEKIKTVSWGATRATGNNRFDRRVDVNIGGQ